MLRWYGYLLGTGKVWQMYCVLSSQQERNVTILFHIPDQPITVCHRIAFVCSPFQRVVHVICTKCQNENCV